MSEIAPRASAKVDRRPVGRPRHYDDQVERDLIMEAAYVALRDQGSDFTIVNILAEAGVSTRSFYRHFTSKDVLLCAMYRRDAEWAARRLHKRLSAATSAMHAVELWIDEIFSFVRKAPRAERVAVLGSIVGSQADGADVEAAHARGLLVAPLLEAIERGIDDGSFARVDAAACADLVAAAVVHAAGLVAPYKVTAQHDQAGVVAFCLRSLGAKTSSVDAT
jgi:AcrR family transcriptional regulator